MTRVSWARRPTRIGAGLAVELVESAGAYGGSPRGEQVLGHGQVHHHRREVGPRSEGFEEPETGTDPRLLDLPFTSKRVLDIAGIPIRPKAGGSSSLRRSLVSDSHCGARSGRAVATVASVSVKRSRTGAMSDSVRDESGPCRTSRRLPKSRLSRSMYHCASGEPCLAFGSGPQADDRSARRQPTPNTRIPSGTSAASSPSRKCATRRRRDRPHGEAESVTPRRSRSDYSASKRWPRSSHPRRSSSHSSRVRWSMSNANSSSMPLPSRCQKTGPGISPNIWQHGQSGSIIASWPDRPSGSRVRSRPMIERGVRPWQFGIGRIEPGVADAFQARDLGREEVADHERSDRCPTSRDRDGSVRCSQQDQSRWRTRS